MEITCPSGLSGNIRGLRVKDQDLLANRIRVRKGGVIDELFASCWLETTQKGPYDFEGNPDFLKVLQGDRLYLAMQIRKATYGNDFLLTIPCGSKECGGKKFELEVPLDEFPVKPYPEESLEKWKKQEGFTTTLPNSGKIVVFKLFDGSDERNISKIREKEITHIMSKLLRLRIKEIHEVGPADLPKFLEEMEYADMQHMQDAWEEVEGGVDTSVEVECPNCGLLQEGELPMDTDFFSISRRKKKS